MKKPFTQTFLQSLQICYRYYSKGRNPATGVIGFEWECSIANYPLHIFYIGDPFNLYQRNGFPDSPILKQSNTNEQLAELFAIDPASIQLKNTFIIE